MRSGSASLYARLVGLNLEPSVHGCTVLDFVVCFLVPHLESGHYFKKNLYVTCVQQRESFSSNLKQSFSSSRTETDAVAVGHTKPGSASLHARARLVGLNP